MANKLTNHPDAEESYSFILNSLRSVKKDNVPVVEKYAMGVMRRT